MFRTNLGINLHFKFCRLFFPFRVPSCTRCYPVDNKLLICDATVNFLTANALSKQSLEIFRLLNSSRALNRPWSQRGRCEALLNTIGIHWNPIIGYCSNWIAQWKAGWRLKIRSDLIVTVYIGHSSWVSSISMNFSSGIANCLVQLSLEMESLGSLMLSDSFILNQSTLFNGKGLKTFQWKAIEKSDCNHSHESLPEVLEWRARLALPMMARAKLRAYRAQMSSPVDFAVDAIFSARTIFIVRKSAGQYSTRRYPRSIRRPTAKRQFGQPEHRDQ